MTVVRPGAAAALFAVVGMLVVCADARAQVPEAPPEDPRQAARIRVRNPFTSASSEAMSRPSSSAAIPFSWAAASV